MWPVVFQSGAWALQTYTLFISIAFFVALFTWFHTGRRYGFLKDALVSLSLGSLVVGLVGARLLYILTQWREVLSGEVRPFALWEGGVVFLGGFLAAVAYLAWAFPRFRMNRRDGFNSAAPVIAFAHAVGRLGCFANGCCHGRFCPRAWGVVYTNPLSAARPLDVPLHPTQLYESVGLVVLGLTLLWWERGPRRLQTFELYLMGYAALRFTVEFFRGDELRGVWWLGLSTSQWLCLALLGAVPLLRKTARIKQT